MGDHADTLEGRTETDAEAVADLIGTGPSDLPEPSERKFMAWHRPRKQYVREHQWAAELKRLVKDGDLRGKQIRYLTLPGDDLLDIRYLHDEVCMPAKSPLRYLGFNKSANPKSRGNLDFTSALYSVNRLDFVDMESDILADDVRYAGANQSRSFQTVRESGPFHAINLDLCGGFAENHDNKSLPNYFSTLDWMLKTQGSASHDSLLFLTSRIDDQCLSEDSRTKLQDQFAILAQQCESMRNRISNEWHIAQFDTVEDLLSQLGSDESIILAFLQWVVSRCVLLEIRPRVSSVYTYRVRNDVETDDLISIAVRLRPSPRLPKDPAGLSMADELPSVEDMTCACSVHIPKKVKSRLRVDEVLLSDPTLWNLYSDKNRALLEKSGFDGAKYHEWSDAKYPKLRNPSISSSTSTSTS